MFCKSVKSLLVAVFSLFLLSSSIAVMAQDHAGAHEEKAEPFDPTKIIMGHIQDGYEFHFFSLGDFDAVIHLPVILYSPEKGLSVPLSF